MCRLSDFRFLDLETERKLDLIKGALNSEEKAQPITYLVAGDEDLSIWEQYSIRESTSIGHRCNRGYRRRKKGNVGIRIFVCKPPDHLVSYVQAPSVADFLNISHNLDYHHPAPLSYLLQSPYS